MKYVFECLKIRKIGWKESWRDKNIKEITIIKNRLSLNKKIDSCPRLLRSMIFVYNYKSIHVFKPSLIFDILHIN